MLAYWIPLLLQAGPPAAPEPVQTSVTVVGRVAAETPAATSTLSDTQLEAIPGSVIDQKLRDVPGFSLFRRSSSLVAHPTTQGVSLRGIGSSGASRTLVLWDGIPINDPFGGWVYWTQIIPAELDRVEVTPSPPASAWGDRAMGGVIGMWGRAAARRSFDASYETGNEGTRDVTLGYSGTWRHWAVSAWGRAFTTDGYFIVQPPFRGSVDRPAGVRFATGDLRLDWFGAKSGLFLKFNALAEERHNGTVLQNNSTGLGTAAAHYQRDFGAESLSLTAFHTREQFHSAFSAIAADRNTERLTFRQTVPAEAAGGAGIWHHGGNDWNLLAGADLYRTVGSSTDRLFPAGVRLGGGSEFEHGVWAQADRRLGWTQWFAGLRHDFTGRGGTFLSPHAGVVLGRGKLRGRASVSRGFRAPTLNELFREFRVGNTVTQANGALRPETMWGAEAGAEYDLEYLHARVTLFRESLADVITNVTLSSSPNLIVRQRQNAAAALSRGGEFSTTWRWRDFRMAAGLLPAAARYANGARIPQVPRWQGSGEVTWQHGGTLAAAGLRAYGAQFDDDLNQFLLPGFQTVQLMLRQRLFKGLSAVVSVENLLDRGYLAGFTPTPITGAPRLWRAGLRWQSSAP